MRSVHDLGSEQVEVELAQPRRVRRPERHVVDADDAHTGTVTTSPPVLPESLLRWCGLPRSCFTHVTAARAAGALWLAAMVHYRLLP